MDLLILSILMTLLMILQAEKLENFNYINNSHFSFVISFIYI